jgi:hypothetical protein
MYIKKGAQARWAISFRKKGQKCQYSPANFICRLKWLKTCAFDKLWWTVHKSLSPQFCSSAPKVLTNLAMRNDAVVESKLRIYMKLLQLCHMLKLGQAPNLWGATTHWNLQHKKLLGMSWIFLQTPLQWSFWPRGWAAPTLTQGEFEHPWTIALKDLNVFWVMVWLKF